MTASMPCETSASFSVVRSANMPWINSPPRTVSRRQLDKSSNVQADVARSTYHENVHIGN